MNNSALLPSLKLPYVFVKVRPGANKKLGDNVFHQNDRKCQAAGFEPTTGHY